MPSRERAFLTSVTLSNRVSTLGDTVSLAVSRACDQPGTDRAPDYFFLDRLAGLADELCRLGMTSRLTAPPGRKPRLHVVNPAASMLAEDVLVGRSQDGVWWYWWPWAQRIAPGDQAASAAEQIARVLRAAS
jgi:hypothetical protein